MIYPATPHAGVMTGGQPESSRVGVRGFFEGRIRGIHMAKAKTPRFISDRIRVSPMTLPFSGAFIHIEARQARPAPITHFTIPVDVVPALIEALSAAAIESAKKAKKGGE